MGFYFRQMSGRIYFLPGDLVAVRKSRYRNRRSVRKAPRADCISFRCIGLFKIRTFLSANVTVESTDQSLLSLNIKFIDF